MAEQKRKKKKNFTIFSLFFFFSFHFHRNFFFKMSQIKNIFRFSDYERGLKKMVIKFFKKMAKYHEHLWITSLVSSRYPTPRYPPSQLPTPGFINISTSYDRSLKNTSLLVTSKGNCVHSDMETTCAKEKKKKRKSSELMG